MNQEEKSIRNIIVGILGGFIGEECWVMLTKGLIPGLIDNMLIMRIKTYFFTQIKDWS